MVKLAYEEKTISFFCRTLYPSIVWLTSGSYMITLNHEVLQITGDCSDLVTYDANLRL